MNKELMYTYIWHEITNMAFTPTDNNGKWIMRWFQSFIKGFYEFLELDAYPIFKIEPDYVTGGKRILCKIFESGLRLHLDINLKLIENWNNLYLAFLAQRETITQNNELWVHDIHPEYFCFSSKALLHEINCINSQRGQAFANYTEDDLRRVLNGLVCHPYVHQHIGSPINNHEIRVGGGFSNPFQYLFHLRYQFCITDERRNCEKERLFDLFNSALKLNNPDYRICPEKLNELPC